MYTKEIAVPNTEIIRAHEVYEYTPSVMAEEEVSSLAEELLPLTAQGFMRDGETDQLRQDVKHHIAGSSRVVVARLREKPNAYICASFNSTGEGLLYHLEGIIVSPEYQGTGLALCMLQREMEIHGPAFLGFHTQSARMLALGSKLASFSVRDVLKYGEVIGTRNQAGVVDVGRYGGECLYGNVNRFYSQAINRLDWKKGDALIFIGRVEKQ